MKVFLLMLFCTISQISGQLIFKYVSTRIQGLADILANRVTFMVFALALSMYALSVFFYVEALRHADVSRLYMYFALAFIIVPVCAHFLFKEPLTIYQILGGVLIVSGIALANFK